MPKPAKRSRTRRPQSAHRWFQSRFGVTRDQGVLAESQLFGLRDSVVLALSSSPRESIPIDLERVEEPAIWLPQIDSARREWWESRRQDLLRAMGANRVARRQVDFTKCAPLLFRPPLKDSPVALIKYCPVKYSVARSFFGLLDEAPDLWEGLARGGADYGARHTPRPGTLAVEMALLTTEPDGTRLVLLAQRSSRQGGLGVHLGRWSASFEEQCVDGEVSVEAAVLRGLDEELLGAQARHAKVNLQAIFLKRSSLNLCVAGLCVTPLAFDDVVSEWQGADDRAEHTQVVGVPAEAATLEPLIREGVLVEDVRKRCRVHPDFRGEWESVAPAAGWRLHPTSALRLALALRWVEAELSHRKRRRNAELSTASWEPNGVWFPCSEPKTSRYPDDIREALRGRVNDHADHLLAHEGQLYGPVEQKGGGLPIEQPTPVLVKEATASPVLKAATYESVFPILAVVPGARATAFVCVTSRFRIHVARMLTPRRHRGERSAADILRDALASEIAASAPATIVVERGRKAPDSGALAALRRGALDVGRNAGLRIVEASFVDACVAIGHSPAMDASVRILSQLYPPIAERLAVSPRGFFRGGDHRRELRPLIAAAVLAHAVALQAIQALDPDALL